MSSFLVVDKKTLSEVTVEGSTIILGDIATIHTHLKRADVAEFVQDGNSLILKLKNGKVIVIKNYFTEDEDEHSDLLFEDGEVLGWLPFLLGGGAAGGIALAAGGSDGDGDKPGSGSDGGNTGGGTGGDKPGSGSEGGNPGGDTGGDKPGSGSDGGNPGGDTGGDKPGSGSDGGNTGGDTGGDKPGSGSEGGNTGGDTGGDKPGSENNAPETTKPNQPLETEEDQPKTGQITDVTDKDGDELTYKVGEEPKNGKVVVDEKTGEYTYKPNPDYHGDDTFTVVVSDGKGGKVTVTVPVTVTPVNDAPTAKPEQGFTTDEDTEHKGQIVAEDKDGDELTYQVGEGPKNGSVDVDEKTGEYTYTPKPGVTGDDTFTVVVSDGNGGEVTVTVPVTVTPVTNNPPTAETEQGFTTDEDTEHKGQIVAEDKDGDELTYKVGEEPKNGKVVVDEKTGEYTYMPDPGFTGDDEFTVTVSDGKGGEVTVTVPVTVTPVNDAPTAKPEQGFTTEEDTEHKGQIVAEDKDGDELTYKVGEGPKNGSVDVDEKTGAYTYTPNEDFNGDDKFTVVVSDGNGGEVTVTVPVTVTPVNDAPTAKPEQGFTTDEDTEHKGQIVAEDKDGDKLSYKVGEEPKNGKVVVDEKTGEYTYMPNEDFNGDDKFTVVVSDGKGGKVTVTVPVTVTPVNDAPTADDSQPLETQEDTPKSGEIVAEDKDGDDLTYVVKDQPEHGTVDLDKETGKYTYTPKDDFNGDDTFTVVVSDGKGGEVTVTVPITVTPVNDAPTAEAEQGFTIDEDKHYTGKIEADDPDIATNGDKLTYEVDPTDEPQNGTVQLDKETGKYTYIPNDNFNGNDHFTVIVKDKAGESVKVAVPIVVNPVNDEPDLEDAEVTVKQGVKDPVIYDVNDASTGKDEDVDGDKLTYAITKGNDDGLFVIDPDTGIITLVDGKMLDHGKAPQHQLEVTATDSSEKKLSSTATITINVSNASKITTEITPKGTITGTTDNVEKGPVKLTITGTDKDGQPVTIERDVELDRPDGSSEGKYTYQLTPEDGIVDGSKVTVEAKTVDRQGDTIHANTELPGYSDEETPGLDLVVPTIEITQVATDKKVTWGEEGKEGFEVKGTTTGVEADQIVTVTFDKTVDGQPVTVEATVEEDGSWVAKIMPEQAAKLLEGSVSAAVKDIAGNEKSAEAVDYTVDAPTAVVTGYGDNIENVLNTVEIAGEVSKTVTISSEIDPNLANDTTKTMVGETITGDHGTFTLDASGKWTYTLNSGEETSKALIDSKGPLTEIFTVKDSDGKPYEVKVSINDRVKDDGENVVVSATTSSVKDPSNVESDQGKFTNYTNDSLGEITGTASQGVEKVRVYINKQTADTDEEMDSLGYPQYFEVAVKDGKWSLSEKDLTDGLQKTWWADQLNNDNIYLQVRAIDPTTGKVGDVSEKYTFVVDTVAPEATYVNYEDGKVTALVSGDPNDTHHAETGNEVIVKYTDTDGKVQVVTGKVGDKAVADKPYLSISVDVNDSSKVDSNTEFKVYVKDNAGNIGVNNDSKENPLKIELPTPEVDQYHDNENNASGTEIIGNAGYSDDPSGLISGTIVLTEEDLKVVDSVRVYLYDNREKYIEIDKKDLVKESDNTYRWTTKPGDLSKVTTTGKFAEGEVTLYAATYDKDSGSLSELSPPFKVTIDVTAPEITIESIAEDGIVSQSEKDKGFSIKGSATGVEEGNTVTVDFNGKTYEGTVTNVKNGHGSWEIKIPSRDASTLEDGKTEEATATVTDNAGNTSDPSSKSAKIHLTVLASTELIEIDEDSGPVTGQVTKTGYSLYHELASEVPPEIGVVEFNSYAYSGEFTFTPAKDWSGTFEFDILVRDGHGNENIVKQIIKVNPVADEPTLSMDMNFDVGELSLNKYVWKNISGKQVINGTTYDFDDNFSGKYWNDNPAYPIVNGRGSGINPEVLENGIDALYNHRIDDIFKAESGTTTELSSEGWIDNDNPGEALAEGDVVFINGLVYLEAGKAYKYEGKADDSAMIKIGDGVSSKYVSWQGLGDQGLAEDLFTVEESGFYTFDLYIYNQDGIGNYNFKVTEADGTNVKYFPNIEAAQEEVSGLVHIDDTLQGSDGKGFYGVKFGYTGSETEDVALQGVAASLTDRDGSETLSMTLTGLVEGTKLFYTAVDMDEKEVLKSAIADADGTITVNGADGVLDFKDLSLDLPEGIATGKLHVELTVTATEKGNGDVKSTSTTFDVNVVKPTAAAKFMLDESDEGDMSELLSAADALQAETPVAFNAALGLSVPTAEMDAPKWAPEFSEGLLSDADTSAYINVNVDEARETVTLSTDQASDEVGSIDAPMLLVADTHDPISFEDLLNHDLTSII